jgi:hypothetical protein
MTDHEEPNKLTISLSEKPKKKSGKLKFLANPNKRPQKGDVPDYMPVLRRDH